MTKIKDPIVTIGGESCECEFACLSLCMDDSKTLDEKESCLRSRFKYALLQADDSPSNNPNTITPSVLASIAKETTDFLMMYMLIDESSLSCESIKEQAKNRTWSKEYPLILQMAAYDLMREHDSVTCCFDGGNIHINI